MDHTRQRRSPSPMLSAVKRIVERHNAGGGVGQRRERGQNYDAVREVAAERVRKTEGRISASCCQVLYRRWRGTPSISGDACRDTIAQNAYHRWRWQRGISRRRPLTPSSGRPCHVSR
jgi:hypothetical protein